MSDDFLRLVSQANPATRQYQPANNGYPPSQGAAGPYSDRSSQLMDPFFDDDDDNAPDSAFGRPAPMQSQESGLPLARSAAPPAGLGPSASTSGLPQGWNFDDDDLQPHSGQPFKGSANFPGPKPQQSKFSQAKSKKWKWPWKKEQVLIGERVIALNNSAANSEFLSNFVSTSKYNLATFMPKFLFGECTPSVFCAILTPNNRAILKICQFVFPVHGLHSADSWSFTNQQIYHHRPSCCGTHGLSIQGDAGRSCSYTAFINTSLVLTAFRRKDISPIESSTPGWLKYWPLSLRSRKKSGRTFLWEMLCDLRATILFRQTWFSLVQVNRKGCVILKLLTWTGESCFSLTCNPLWPFVAKLTWRSNKPRHTRPLWQTLRQSTLCTVLCAQNILITPFTLMKVR